MDYFTIKLNDNKKRSATVGRRTTIDNYVTLDPSVTDEQSIFHELLHVIGLLHEHQRQRSVRTVPQSITFDIVSRCFENKNNNC